jgi:hypothetical protein
MKNLMFGLILSFLVNYNGYANSQTLAEVEIQKPVFCVELQKLTEIVDKFQELPTVHGINVSFVNGIIVETSMVIFVNATTRSYTIAEKRSENVYCIIIMGKNMEAISR